MFSTFKARCSALANVMADSKDNRTLTEKQAKDLAAFESKDSLTPPQQIEMVRLQGLRENGKKVILGDTTIQYLLEWYSWKVYGKVKVEKELEIDFTAKGREMEEASIKLLSIINKRLYIKNPYRFENEFLTGEMDIIDMDEAANPIEILDVKSAWDHTSFLRKVLAPVSKDNDLQVKGYMDIVNCPKGTIAHCLVNNPEWQIHKFIESARYQMNIIMDDDPKFIQKSKEIERSMRFDDIPMNQRVYKIPVEPFTEEYKQKLYDRVKICREWLFNFNEKMVSLS